MRPRTVLAGLTLVCCRTLQPSVGMPANARGELRVWTTRAIATVLTKAGPEFERTSGDAGQTSGRQ